MECAVGQQVGVWGLGFGVWGLGFGVWGLGFVVWGLGFGVWGFMYEWFAVVGKGCDCGSAARMLV